MGASTILSIESLYAGYGAVDVLRDVSLNVDRGEVVSVIGPNGAGKSTLLRAIYGMADVRSGRIAIDGRELKGASTSARIEAGVALVLQGRCNFPSMTVLENLEMGGFTLPRSRVAERRQAVCDLLPLLAERSGAKAGQLSGGQQQLLEIGMMLMVQPSVLMLDEPTLGLDGANSSFVLELVRTLADSGLAVLMVEQNARKALAVSHRALVLADGRSHMEGPAKSILNDPTVAQLYLGSEQQ